MHTSNHVPSRATTSTHLGTSQHIHKFLALLVSLGFAGAAAALLWVPPVDGSEAIAGMIAGSGIAAGIMLGSIPWSRIAPVWLETYAAGIAILVAVLVRYSGAAASPYASLFFLATACVMMSSRRRATWLVTTVIAALHLLPLIYGFAEQQFTLQILFSIPIHLAIAMVGSMMGVQLPEDRHSHIERGYTGIHAAEPVRDQLTGLRTRTALAQHLSETHTQPWSMVLVGVDQWQALCEKYGRGSADDIVRQVAVILQSHSRSSDIPTRYNDHTFLIIFPNASAEIAMKLGERLRAVLEEHRFWTPHSPTRLAITVSLGVAAYPQDGVTADELAQKAMQRMALLQQAPEALAGAAR